MLVHWVDHIKEYNHFVEYNNFTKENIDKEIKL